MISKTITAPDTGNEYTPKGVSDFKDFKSKLMAGETINSNSLSQDTMSILPKFSLSSQGPTSDVSEDYAGGAADEAGLDDAAYEQPSAPVFTPSVAPSYKARDTAITLAAYLEALPAKEEVKIIGDFGKLSLKAINVSITEFGVAFVIKKDDIQFEPNINTSLKIEYKGVEYEVVYAGGFFTFPKIAFTFVSFLRVNP